MKDFVRQLRWEIQKLWWRPRTYLGFAVTFAFELLLCLLWSLPSVRAVLAKEIWRTHLQVEDAFSGLTIAVHLTGETMAMIGMLFLGLIASDVIAKEIEDGTLRLALCRPVGRTAVFAQKVMSCAVYTFALTFFVAISALVLGLAFAGPGRLVVVAFRESLLTVLGFQTGLARYVLATVMLFGSMATVTALGVALACWGLRPAAMVVVGASILTADHLIRLQPGFEILSGYTLTTRLLSWRQVFSDPIPWLRLQRNFGQLAILDAVLLLLAWWAFRRREL